MLGTLRLQQTTYLGATKISRAPETHTQGRNVASAEAA